MPSCRYRTGRVEHQSRAKTSSPRFGNARRDRKSEGRLESNPRKDTRSSVECPSPFRCAVLPPFPLHTHQFSEFGLAYLNLESPAFTPHEVFREDGLLGRISAEKGQEIEAVRGGKQLRVGLNDLFGLRINKDCSGDERTLDPEMLKQLQ